MVRAVEDHQSGETVHVAFERRSISGRLLKACGGLTPEPNERCSSGGSHAVPISSDWEQETGLAHREVIVSHATARAGLEPEPPGVSEGSAGLQEEDHAAHPYRCAPNPWRRQA